MPQSFAREGQVTQEVLFIFAKGKHEAIRRYRIFVGEGVILGKREDLGGGRRMSRPQEGLAEESYDERVLGSGKFVEELRMRRELKSKFPQAVDIKDIVAKVCHHGGVDPEELRLNTPARPGSSMPETSSVISQSARQGTVVLRSADR